MLLKGGSGEVSAGTHFSSSGAIWADLGEVGSDSPRSAPLLCRLSLPPTQEDSSSRIDCIPGSSCIASNGGSGEAVLSKTHSSNSVAIWLDVGEAGTFTPRSAPLL